MSSQLNRCVTKRVRLKNVNRSLPTSVMLGISVGYQELVRCHSLIVVWRPNAVGMVSQILASVVKHLHIRFKLRK